MRGPFGCLLVLVIAPAALEAQFQFRDLNPESVQLSENNAPVFVYNYGTMRTEGIAADRARCCYLHPVWAPNGAVVTDDFPRDHPHHRGVSWMWPVVVVDGKSYDLWTIHGIHDRFEEWIRKEATQDRAVLAFQDGWYIGERKVVDEQVEIVAHPLAGGRRDINLTVSLRSAGADVSIGGTHDLNKGYGGGLNIRFAPRTGTGIRTAAEEDAPDSDQRPAAWAELSGDFEGKQATTRVTIAPSNPGTPNGWCLRHYGFVGVEYPGLRAVALSPDKPLEMKFRVSLSGSSRVSRSPEPKVLVYTHNGKGYVHDNIAASVAAIRKMGAENGFGVDVADDPVFFTDATLRQYRALVFANTNNKAFQSDAQRDAFRRYIEAGGGFVGIHSASGSERDWPYFWSVLGGKFVRHPKMQMFDVRVKDGNFPATRKLPATFAWTDECYYLDHLNPDIHTLLVTDPAKIVDPQKGEYPGDRFGDALPLAWYHEFDRGREFYTALGHNKADYANPILYDQILGGIVWAMGEKQEVK